jgi:putative pyruvate formate lyase activating enzyme
MSTLLDHLKHCTICPNACGVDRLAGEKGRCRTGADIVVASANLHFGEEPVLVGRSGSGTVFFTACNLACVFCQNYDTSQLDYGQSVSRDEFLRVIFSLKQAGAVNINLVSPTHQAPQIFEGIKDAKAAGLRLPIVYNCGGYEDPAFLRELAGLVDIYMPDFKYSSNEAGETYSGVQGYADWCRKALLEMHRQVGDLELDERGLARRGLLVRHLVLPQEIAGSRGVIDFIADRISKYTALNIMDQYRPCWRADRFRELKRSAYRSEVDEVVDYARGKGMDRLIG